MAEGGAFARHELADAYRQAGRPWRRPRSPRRRWPRSSGSATRGRPTTPGSCSPVLYRAARRRRAARWSCYAELVERLPTTRPAGPDRRGRGRPALPAGPRRPGGGAVRAAAAADLRAAGRPDRRVAALRRQGCALHWASRPAEPRDRSARSPKRVRRPAAPRWPTEPDAVWERAMLDFETGPDAAGAGRPDEALCRTSRVRPSGCASIGAIGDADQVATACSARRCCAPGAPGEAEAAAARGARPASAGAPERRRTRPGAGRGAGGGRRPPSEAARPRRPSWTEV